MVKIPGTEAGLPAIRDVIAAGISVNVTLLFGVERYGEVIDAYLDGLELTTARSSASPASRRSSSAGSTRPSTRSSTPSTPTLLAAFGVGRRSPTRSSPTSLFLDRFSGPRWEALAARGAQVQRPLWASTSTKDPSYPTTLYVDTLIAPEHGQHHARGHVGRLPG
jgi:transaldolase